MFAQKLYSLISNHSASQKQLSLDTNIPQSDISKFLAKEKYPKYDQIVTISEYYNIHPATFFIGKPDVDNIVYKPERSYQLEHYMVEILYEDKYSKSMLLTIHALSEIYSEDFKKYLFLEGHNCQVMLRVFRGSGYLKLDKQIIHLDSGITVIQDKWKYNNRMALYLDSGSILRYAISGEYEAIKEMIIYDAEKTLEKERRNLHEMYRPKKYVELDLSETYIHAKNKKSAIKKTVELKKC